MNSRSSVNESNLVNLSGDLLNPLDTKESLALSFPFDHIYACHSEESDRRQSHLDKEVEIIAHPDDKEPVPPGEQSLEVNRLSERLTAAEIQNQRLKSLLVYHLDLIQQQNDLITKKEKQNTALQLENDSLKSKVTRMDRRITVSQRHNVNPAPVLNLPPPTSAPPSTSAAPPSPCIATTIKTEPGTSDSQLVYSSISDFLVPETRKSPYIFNNDITKSKPLMPDAFDLNRPAESDVPNYLSGDIGVPSILDNSGLPCDNFNTMIENKQSYIKKEIKTEPRPEPLYTVTSNSGNTVIQKIQRNRRRTSGGLGSLSRLPKTPVVKTEPQENVFDDDKAFERSFSVNKKSKMINTYGKSKNSNLSKKTPHYTGSLSDRLQLIDTTPTGEDPYQLGEADMREQSPIPKLMLQKTNHGRLKICSDLVGESTIPSRRIYDAPATETSSKMPNKIKLEKRYNLPNMISYSSAQATTHTLTHSSLTTTDAGSMLSTYSHVPKSSAHTPKQSATSKQTTPKQTTRQTPAHTSKHSAVSTNTCTYTNTYAHTTRNSSTRSASHTTPSKGRASQRSSQTGSRKSSQAAANKLLNVSAVNTVSTVNSVNTVNTVNTGNSVTTVNTVNSVNTVNPVSTVNAANTPKPVIKTSLTTTLNNLHTATLAALHMVPLALTHTPSQGHQLHAAIISTPLKKTTLQEIKKESQENAMSTPKTAILHQPLIIQQPALVKQSGLVQQPGIVQQSGMVQQPSILQQPAIVQQAAKLQQLKLAQQSTLAQQPGCSNVQQDVEVKKEPGVRVDWSLYNSLNLSSDASAALNDFYTEDSGSPLPQFDVAEFRQLMENEAAAAAAAAALDKMDSLDYGAVEKNETDLVKKRGARTASLIAPGVMEEESTDNRRGMGSKRGRKRALSSAGLMKNAKQNLSKAVGPKAKINKGKAACRGKKSPLPGMTTGKPYHTLVGDPDLSWYLGLDPDVKQEDIDQGDCKASTVEVPRWREKPYSSLYSLEGTENLDDKIFEKRHQKLEAEERRQLRWHMRRIREQRHVERLRMRQRDPWYSGHSHYQPSVYTIWPQPQRDVRMIEITDTIPVMAFGEDLPDIPPADFMLPWVRTSKALKRSKRSKTLH